MEVSGGEAVDKGSNRLVIFVLQAQGSELEAILPTGSLSFKFLFLAGTRHYRVIERAGGDLEPVLGQCIRKRAEEAWSPAATEAERDYYRGPEAILIVTICWRCRSEEERR